MTLATQKIFTIEEYHRLTEIGFFHYSQRQIFLPNITVAFPFLEDRNLNLSNIFPN